jgi:ABC-type sugar transport system permease subunit
MPHRTFIQFVLPSLVAMLLFIALPIVSAVVQSLYVENPKVLVTVESCDPFGCKKQQHVDNAATDELQRQHPFGQFSGLMTYANSHHLAFADVSAAWHARVSLWSFISAVMALPFYKALTFTLAYTLVVTPIVLILGFFIALAVNMLPKIAKGPIIFTSLLPMIITPLIGSLVLFWMIDANGIIGGTLQRLSGNAELSLKASAVLTWIMLFVYGIWNATPFAFVVLYAGLQTVPRDTLESAVIDGASKWERVRYVVLPHLAPLVMFVGLIQLMDNFRVFEPIVGFSADANATSLSWVIYNDLRGQGTPLFGSAAATSVLTIIGVSLLMLPVLRRTWRDFSLRS